MIQKQPIGRFGIVYITSMAFLVACLAVYHLFSMGHLPSALLVAALLYSVPLLAFLAYAHLFRAIWWVATEAWKLRSRPIPLGLVGLATALYIVAFVWGAPAVNADVGQFDLVVVTLAVVEAIYLTKLRRAAHLRQELDNSDEK